MTSSLTSLTQAHCRSSGLVLVSCVIHKATVGLSALTDESRSPCPSTTGVWRRQGERCYDACVREHDHYGGGFRLNHRTPLHRIQGIWLTLATEMTFCSPLFCQKGVGQGAILQGVGQGAILQGVDHGAVLQAVGQAAVLQAVGHGAILQGVGQGAVLQGVGHGAVLQAVGQVAVLQAVGHGAVLQIVGHGAVLQTWVTALSYPPWVTALSFWPWVTALWVRALFCKTTTPVPMEHMPLVTSCGSGNSPGRLGQHVHLILVPYNMSGVCWDGGCEPATHHLMTSATCSRSCSTSGKRSMKRLWKFAFVHETALPGLQSSQRWSHVLLTDRISDFVKHPCFTVRNAIIIRKLYLYGTDFSSWICLKSIVKRMKWTYDWLTMKFLVPLWFTKWPLNSWVVYFMLGISPESVVHQFQWHNAKWWIL